MISRGPLWLQEERKIYLRDVLFLLAMVLVSIAVSEKWLLKSDASLVDRIFTYLLLFVPLGTINLIAHYYYRNRRIRITGNLRSSLRYRLSIAFMLIAIIPSLPIFLVSANNVDAALEGLFNINVVRGVRAADRLVRYYEDRELNAFRKGAEAANANANLSWLPALAVAQNYLKSSAFDPGRDAWAIYRGRRRRTQSRPVFPEHLPEDLAAATHASSPGADRRMLADGEYLILGYNVSEGDRLLLARRLHPELDSERSRLQQLTISIESEDFWRGHAPNTLRLGIALLYVFMVCSALLLSILIARQISMPIVALAAATRAVTDGDLDARIEFKSAGELGILIESFNQMTAELRSLRARLLHSQRLAAWQEVARRLAHEIRNPLTPIQLSADRMLRRLDHPGRGDLERVVRSGCGTIVEQVKALKQLVDEFAAFARLPKARPARQSLDAIVAEAVQGFQGAIPGISLETQLNGNLPEVEVDRTIVVGMINNLVKNAAEAILSASDDLRRTPARIRISTSLLRQGPRQFVSMSVEDTGPGVDEGLRDRIFEPYFSTKGGYGSGLGLSLVERAAMEHEARIVLGRSELGGAEFSVLFRIAGGDRGRQ
ncbi:MAG: HAMP domain-containing protein [Leptospirales bacterium]|nr:HAMP domain-containing protein [Leptospirales bacterium]